MRQPFCNYNICEMSGKSATSGFDHSDHQEQEEKQERCSDRTDDIIGNICMRSRKGFGCFHIFLTGNGSIDGLLLCIFKD